MHTDLSRHLHTAKCNEIIEMFLKCHEDNPLKKFLGYCDVEERQMRRCLKEERLEKRRINFEKSKERKKRQKLWPKDVEE